jgi:hypothetical protein
MLAFENKKPDAPGTPDGYAPQGYQSGNRRPGAAGITRHPAQGGKALQ